MSIVTFVDHTIPVAADFNDSYDFINTEVRTFERGGTGLSSYTKGDILYASATNTVAKLAIAGYGSVLGVASTGLPAWSRTLFKNGADVVAAGGGTNSVFSGGALTLVGGTLGTANRLRVTAQAIVTNNSGGALLFEYFLTYGISNLILSSESFANGTTNGIYNVTVDFVADASTSAQLAISRVILLGTSTKLNGIVAYAIDSTTNHSFDVTLSCAATGSYTVRYAMVEVIV